MLVQCTCETCGKAYSVKSSHAAHSRFCSRKCQVPVPARPVAERFWEKVDNTGECWIWTAARFKDGYGKFGLSHAEGVDYAHRIAWRLTFGAIPEGLKVLHHCDNPPCVRIDHLFLGTTADNNRDKASKNRGMIGESHVHALLTVSRVIEARRRISNGEQVQVIAAEWGLSVTTIWKAARGITWARVEEPVVTGEYRGRWHHT